MEKRGYAKPLYVFGIILFIYVLFNPLKVKASDADTKFVWISVDATDDNSGLTYALDTTDPAAFGPTNRFMVEEGTNHTIYVKDIAGNITSQDYSAIKIDRNDDNANGDINLDIEVGDNMLKSSPDYVPGSYGKGDGTGTLKEETITDGKPDSQKLFYTVESREGEQFYLVVDHTDSEDNVYFLDGVRLNDLSTLAMDYDTTIERKSADEGGNSSLLSTLSEDKKKEVEEATTAPAPAKKKSSSGNGMTFVVLIVMAIGFGAYYYIKVYSKKKDAALDLQDAHDMEDFEGQYDDDYEKYEYNEDEDEDEIFDTASSQEELSNTVSDAYLAEMADDVNAEERNNEPVDDEADIADYPKEIDLYDSDNKPIEAEKQNTSSFSFGNSINDNDDDEYNKYGDDNDDDDE